MHHKFHPCTSANTTQQQSRPAERHIKEQLLPLAKTERVTLREKEDTIVMAGTFLPFFFPFPFLPFFHFAWLGTRCPLFLPPKLHLSPTTTHHDNIIIILILARILLHCRLIAAALIIRHLWSSFQEHFQQLSAWLAVPPHLLAFVPD